MKLAVGLGNPGAAYEGTRHNVGFMVMDALARRYGASFRKLWWRPVLAAACRIGEEVRLVKPTTFMNLSGRAVWSALRRWRLGPEDLVVVYDDVDLPLGVIRVRGKGSPGSHNGMRSVTAWLGTESFARVRVGIGPRPPGEALVEYVLGRFSEEERLKLEKVVEQAADAVESLFSVGLERTMSAFNRKGKGEGN